MTRATRNLRKTLDSVADNNETAAFDLMRAVEKLGDEVLRQRSNGPLQCSQAD